MALRNVRPAVIVECKAFSNELVGNDWEQLNRYACASPRMNDGVAVLSNGGEWRLYVPRGSGDLPREPACTVGILSGGPS